MIAELESLLRMMPREGGETSATSQAKEIRFGTEVYHAREVLVQMGKPMYVGEILKSQGKDDSKGPRSSLASQLGTYARECRIFTKEGPNIFGLIDFKDMTGRSETNEEADSEEWQNFTETQRTAPTPAVSVRPATVFSSDDDIPF